MEIGVDFAFLRKFAIVPWNIVAYNIFGGEGRGPEIFGTEPWTFYIRNLLLNFNIWFVFAISAAPLLLFQALFRQQTTSKETLWRTVTLITPFYMWFAIFTLQPHKEERFMYPAYPFLALNASISFHMILSYVGSGNPRELMGRIPAKLKLTAVMTVVLAAINAGLLRTVGMITAYNAPLKVFAPLEESGVAQAGDSVCFGKEWYRFPSSFFLPEGMRAKFIRSEFRGLLPGEFPDSSNLASLLAGTSQIPQGMNDVNEEDPSKYVSLAVACDYSKLTGLIGGRFTMFLPGRLVLPRTTDHAARTRLCTRRALGATLLQGLPGYIPDRTSWAVDLDPRLADHPGSIPPQMGPILSPSP